MKIQLKGNTVGRISLKDGLVDITGNPLPVMEDSSC